MNIHPLADMYPSMSDDEYQSLVADIHEHGLCQPLLLHPDGSLLDGRHRWRAIDDLAERGVIVEPRFQEWDGCGDLVSLIHSLNFHRRHLNVTQKACIGVGYKRELQETLKPGNPSGTNQHSAGNCGNVSIIPPRPALPARDQAAAKVGVSGKVVDMAERIMEVAPEKGERMMAGELSVWDAKKEIEYEAKEVLAEQLNAQPVPLPDGKFNVITCDPPWSYDNRAADLTHRARNPYPDMTLPEIKALPVSGMAEDNCVLWLWTTNAFLRDAFDCLDAWGFTYKTMLTWDKEIMGLGDWLRGQSEHCLLAVRGRPLVTLTNQTTMLRSQRNAHSRKPPEFIRLVESLCPGTKLEMFSRESKPGWACWGAETEKFDKPIS